MGGLLSYSLSVSVIITVIFPVLHQLINRSRYFSFNRLAIIGGLMLSLTLPLAIDIIPQSFMSGKATVNPDSIINMDAALSELQSTNVANDSETAMPWLPVVIIIYISGIVVLSCREILSFIRLFRMIAASERKKTDGLTICHITDNVTAPFSWGRYIFLKGNDSDNSTCIYIHEKAHTDHRHWIDILLADIICILLWYNPFAWMTRQLMKLNHEFEADEAVISSGIDAYDYQRLLVVKAMGNRSNPVTNSFAANKRSFRKRILIMTKKRSSKKTMLIALCAIPAVAVAGTTLLMPITANILTSISEYSLNNDLLNVDSQSDSTDNELTTESELTKPDNETPTVIPSPFEDQKPLADIIRFSVETIQPDKDTKVNINIVVDEDGRVKDVSADTPDGAEVAAAISRNFNGVRLEQIVDNGRPLEVHFVVPVHIKKKE